MENPVRQRILGKNLYKNSLCALSKVNKNR